MSSEHSPLIAWTERGLFCAQGGFYIDPHRAVDIAVVTHAHSDHARRGCKQYHCAASSVGLLKARLGAKIQVQGHRYGDVFHFGEVRVSLHPAGHILGSAQVRVECRGEVWVASGDYKRAPDPSCEPFQPVACDTFITEATFGTPRYVWNEASSHGREIAAWWDENAKDGFNSLLFGYSLGKAQRILAELEPFAKQPVLVHDSIEDLCRCYREEGRRLAPTRVLSGPPEKLELDGELILAPPAILEGEWRKRLGRIRTAFASGWMQGSSRPHGQSYDHGFIMSDHADWNALNRTIEECGAKRVFVLHRDGALVRHLRKKGLDAHPAEALVRENFLRLPQPNLTLF